MTTPEQELIFNKFLSDAEKFIRDKDYFALAKEIETLFSNDELLSSNEELFGNVRTLDPLFFIADFLPMLKKAIQSMDDMQQEKIITAIGLAGVPFLNKMLSAFKDNESFCDKLLIYYIKNILQEDNLYFLSIKSPALLSIFKNVIRSYFQNQDTFDQLVSYAAKYLDIKLIHFLKETNGVLFENSVSKLSALDRDSAQEMLLREANSVAFNCMPRLIKGVDAFDYECALLICAAVADKADRGNKGYQFDPVILNIEKVGEIGEFIRFVYEHPAEIGSRHIKFVMTDSTPLTGHWITGQIEFNENGEMDILLMDSLGNNEKVGAVNEAGFTSKKIIEALNKLDANAKANIFYSSEKRQNAKKVCAIFALDDCRHLFTVENFLPSQYKGIFDFLRQKTQSKPPYETTTKKHVLNRTKLPLYLLKTWQSKALKDEVESRSDEARLPLNKKQPAINAIETINSYFKIDMQNKATVNERLSQKLAKMRENSKQFLKLHSDEEAEKIMQSFSFEGFKQRLLHPNKPNEH